MSNEQQKIIAALVHRLEELKSNIVKDTSVDSEIAIVGMSCRFPGGASSPELFYELLAAGYNGLSEVPGSRWDIDAYYDSDEDCPGKINCRNGGFIQEDISLFDPGFFNISPREALSMDPQQRLLLELVWEAFERANIKPSRVRHTQAGVYLGIRSSGYLNLYERAYGNEGLDNFAGTGNAMSSAAGRISFFLGLHGPSLSIDTACSSSLVALHYACEGLIRRECTLSIVGGSHLLLTPDGHIIDTKTHMLSASGRCRPFDERADGFVRSEGLGVLLLKRLEDALEDKDTILAVIKGTAVNQDGDGSGGMGVPNGQAQSAVIHEALKKANLLPDDIDYIEAMGVGSPVADLIEFNALKAVFKNPGARAPLMIGSLKSNLGHMEPASGIGSIIKVVLSMQHQQMLQNSGFEQLNPLIDLKGIPAEILAKNKKWSKPALRAGVSSFSMTGTNAHVILENAPEQDLVRYSSLDPQQKDVFFISAKTPMALEEYAQRYREFLKNNLDINLCDLCYTLWTGREQFHYLIAIECTSVSELLGALEARSYRIQERAKTDLEQLKIYYEESARCKVALPTYPFERQRIWIEEKRSIHLGNIDSPFIYNREKIPGYGIFFDVEINPIIDPFLLHHVILSHPIFPGAGFVELLLEAIKTIDGAYIIDELTIVRPLEIKGVISLKLILRGENDTYQFSLSDREENVFIEGTISSSSSAVDIVLLPELSEQIDVDKFYERLDGMGMSFGPHFKPIHAIRRGETSAVSILKPVDEPRFCVYPVSLDGALQLLTVFVEDNDSLYLPFQLKNIRFNPHAGTVEKVYTQILRHDNGVISARIQLLDNLNRVRLEVGEFSARKTGKEQMNSLLSGKKHDLFARGSWERIDAERSDEVREARIFRDLSDISGIQDFLSSPGEARLVFVTQNHEPGELLGFVKSLILEYSSVPIQLIDIVSESDLPDGLRVLNEPLISCCAGEVYAWRLRPYSPLPEHYQLVKGHDQLSDLHFIERPLPELLDDEVEVALQATGLNFRDVLNGMGLYPGDPGPLGGEGAGIITRVGKKVTQRKVGERVFGFVSGGFCTNTVTNEHLVVPVPEGMSTAQSAALPIVYSTVYYALEQLAQLKPGSKVLIHAAAGGVGLAAIALCDYLGAEVYATCSEEKRAYLSSLSIKHIYNSRTTDFSAAIMHDTEQQGVDVVLNSLTSEGFINASLACLKKGGVFLEIGKRNIYSKEQMRSDVDYHVVALDTLAAEQPQQIREILQIVQQRIAQGALGTLPVEYFSLEDSVSAFEKLQRAQNIGKIVVTQSFPFRPNAHVLISGGLGALGQLVTGWLQEQGVKHLSVMSRSVAEHPLPGVDYYQADVAEAAQVERVVALANKKYPLTGIFHLAGIADSGIFSEQNADRFKNASAAKALGAFHLHKATQAIPLDCFVMFSSSSSSMGAAGQTSYAAANSFLDHLACLRHRQGLPAQSIQWGAWLEIGMVARILAAQPLKGGIKALKTDQGLAALKQVLGSSFPSVQIAHIDWHAIAKREGLAPWMQLMAKGLNNTAKGQLIDTLKQVEKTERRKVLLVELSRILSEALGTKDIPADRGFFDSGMDSLMAVEVRNHIQQVLGAEYKISNTLLFEHTSLAVLADYLQHQVLFKIFEQEKLVKPVVMQHFAAIDEAIAVIGMHCRFPGGASDTEKFWMLLSSGYDGVSIVPKSRWDIEQYYDPDPDAPGKINTRFGGFLQEDVSLFDADFFNISPREAQMMDPQQRLLLEVVWHALQHAGIESDTLKNTAVGVYLGMGTQDYGILQQKYQTENEINAYLATGRAFSVAAGRIAFTLGFQGPTMSVDTACSSSLVATHLAVQGLRAGEVNMAVVAGVNLLLAPDLSINFAKAHMLASDGHCKTFDAAADGYVRGEGCAVILLKREADARRDGDFILALIKGSAVNQDGASSGLTVPNGSAQEAVIRQALANAQVAPESIDYIEAHGTGTSLGDPIEVQALSEIHRERTRLLYLSSTKTYIGHLEAAAGIAGVIRTILSLQHRQIPAHQNFNQLNPLIHLDTFHGHIPMELTPWDKADGPRRAGVSAFGFSGTNAHLILEEAPPDYSSQRQSLALTVFKRERYWLEMKCKVQHGNVEAPFIYNRHKIPGFGFLFEAVIDSSAEQSLKDHVILSHTLFPGAGFVELVLEAIGTFEQSYIIEELTVEHPLVLTEAIQLNLILSENKSDYVFSLSDVAEERYIEGKLSLYMGTFNVISLPQLQDMVVIDSFYTHLNEIGLNYGPAFKRIKSIYKNEHCALATLEPVPAGNFCIHPVELDSALQVVAALLLDKVDPYLPFQFKKVCFNPNAGALDKIYVELLQCDDSALSARIQLLDNLNRVRLEVGEFSARKTGKKQMNSLLSGKKHDLFARGSWERIDAERSDEVREARIFRDLSDISGIQDFLSSPGEERLVFVTQNHEPGELLGFVKSLILEYSSVPIQLIDIASESDLPDGLRVLNEPLISCCAGEVYVWRLRPYLPLPEHYQLVKGDDQLSDLHFIERPLPELLDDEVEVALQATGLNFRDVLNGMGLYPGDPGPLGGEGAGIITRVGKKVTQRKVGERVFGFVSGGFCTNTVTNEHLIVPVPEGMSTAQSAALPIVYSTVYYALEQLAQLKPGSKVLIHAAAGGVGLAAIALCDYLGAEVYATCSEEKRAYLSSLSIKHIYNSRTTDFSAAIMHDTEQQGVDVVLNSLTSEGFIDASLACLKKGGVFLEIGKRNIYSKEQMRSDVDYHVVALDTLAAEQPQQIGEILQIVQQRIAQGALGTLPVEYFSLEDSVSAFEKLQRAQNIGKIVVTQSFPFRPNAHVLISGGLGALGQLVTGWLQEQGVKHLSVMSRSVAEHPLPGVDYYQADVAEAAQVERVVALANKKYPLTGIFHLAGILDDGLFVDQNLARFDAVWRAKALGALNLHAASSGIALDCFVLFSSIASSMGSPGQTNYSAANSFMDHLANLRHQQGLPVHSIQWGPWMEAGMAARLALEHTRKGVKPLNTEESLIALKKVLVSSMPIVQIADISWHAIASRDALLPWMQLMAKGVRTSGKGQLISLLQQVEKSERSKVLLLELTQIVTEVLGTKEMLPNKGFFDSGMDSLMAVEARNRIQHALGSEYVISNTLLFEHINLEQLSDYIASVLTNLFDVQQKNRSIEDEADSFLSKITAGFDKGN